MSVGGEWVPGGKSEHLCGAAPPQQMRLNPYIVDVDYMKIDKKINKKMDKLTQQLHESLRA
jgi:Trm5-related predicted tRNA methylase